MTTARPSNDEQTLHQLRHQLRELDMDRARLPINSEGWKDYTRQIEILDERYRAVKAALPQRQAEHAADRRAAAWIGVTGVTIALVDGALVWWLGLSAWWLLGALVGVLLALVGFAGATGE